MNIKEYTSLFFWRGNQRMLVVIKSGEGSTARVTVGTEVSLQPRARANLAESTSGQSTRLSGHQKTVRHWNENVRNLLPWTKSPMVPPSITPEGTATGSPSGLNPTASACSATLAVLRYIPIVLFFNSVIITALIWLFCNSENEYQLNMNLPV